MNRLYIATCPNTDIGNPDFDIIVYASNTKEARRLILKNYYEEYCSYCIVNESHRDICGRLYNTLKNQFKPNKKFKLTRIDRLNQIPNSWRELCPWSVGSDCVDGDHANCTTLFQKYNEKLKKKRAENKKNKTKFLAEQAKRLNKILEKRGVDALFLYSLIDHGLNEKVVEFWKKEYLPPLLKDIKYIYANDKGDLQSKTFYFDKAKKNVWVLGDAKIISIDKYRKLILEMMESTYMCIYGDPGYIKRYYKRYVDENGISFIEKSVPTYEDIRKYTVAGLEYSDIVLKW